MSLLSFVVPIHNPDLPLFEKCVKALVDQSLKSWEVIFVLDGPCPAARQIIARVMKKSANHYKILEQEHTGVQRARNYGCSEAKGDFLVCWDCDCVIEPETAQTWVDQFEKYPEIGFIYSGYRFFPDADGNEHAINGKPFDPYTLKVRNYISTMFPLRREFYPGWNESLKSLQDWDYWLSAVEKGAKGKFLDGYAFVTALPNNQSISGQGCKDDVWLERLSAVKKAHNLPDRKVCVSSLGSPHEGLWLAKLIDADYQDIPNDKPHNYETIIQVGFSLLPGRVEHHSGIFNDKKVKNVLFWTCEDITEIWTRLNMTAVKRYRILLNGSCHKQFVEDKTAYDLMKEAGFNVEILPLPMAAGEVHPLPRRPKFACDINVNYNFVFDVLQKSLPDVDLEPIGNVSRLEDLTGLCHFHPDRTVSPSMKRAVIAGRGVVSNVQAPFMGYVDDTGSLDVFLSQTVEKIRALAYDGPPKQARDFHLSAMSPDRLKECINA